MIPFKHEFDFMEYEDRHAYKPIFISRPYIEDNIVTI